MIIKVKVLDENGKVKGRAYTYKSEIEVSVGELVVADMAGKDKTLVVTEICDSFETDGLDYEIKTIKGLSSDIEENTVEEIATEEVVNLDIKIEKEVLPVIKINFEEMKSALTKTLAEYNGIVVTEQSLSKCKATQKELASVRVKLDTYRKDKKKLLSKPITDFENQCKELIALVEQAEEPIKEGIKKFDNVKRDNKRITAVKLIGEVIEEQRLNEKYGKRLDVLEKYCTLSVKEKEVKEDLISRAMTLKVEQDREEELIDIIKDAIESENERINRKIKFEDFKRFIDRGMSTKDVIAEIKLSANRIYEAENPPIIEEPEPIIEVILEPVQAPIIEPIQEAIQIPEPIIEVVPEPVLVVPIPFEIEDDSTYFAVYRIVGKLEQLRSVSKFLKDNGINYNVTDQGEV